MILRMMRTFILEPDTGTGLQSASLKFMISSEVELSLVSVVVVVVVV